MRGGDRGEEEEERRMSEDLRVKKRKWKLGDVEEGFIRTTKGEERERERGDGYQCKEE